MAFQLPPLQLVLCVLLNKLLSGSALWTFPQVWPWWPSNLIISWALVTTLGLSDPELEGRDLIPHQAWASSTGDVVKVTRLVSYGIQARAHGSIGEDLPQTFLFFGFGMGQGQVKHLWDQPAEIVLISLCLPDWALTEVWLLGMTHRISAHNERA